MSAKKVELPDFWEKHPHLWFARAEEEFSLKGISQDSTRYSYLVARLPESVAARVHDELMAKDDKLPYTVLKARLLTTFSPSDYQRGEQILDLPASHAEKPSVTMDRMLSLLPQDVSRAQPGFLFRTLFLRKMPPDIRILLSDEKSLSMRDLALKADVFWASRPAAAAAACVAAVPPPLEFSDEAPGVAHGSYTVPAAPATAHSAHAVPAGAAQAAASVSAVSPPNSLCFYHDRFGAQARKCEPGCSYRPRLRKGNRRGRRN